MSRTANLVVAEEECRVCGACVGVCPPMALVLGAESLLVDQEACTACGICVFVCPTACLSTERVRPRREGAHP